MRAQELLTTMSHGQLALYAAKLEGERDRAVELASGDSLTGLRSRPAILRHLEVAMSRSMRHGTPLAVLMVDLDHFKQVNDTHGHLAGDEVLRQVGRAIQGLLRTTDAAGRYGGEELLVVAETRDPATLAERIRSSVEALAFTGKNGDVFQVTCSVGVTTYRIENDLASIALLARADAALYAAKDNGRNTWRMTT